MIGWWRTDVGDAELAGITRSLRDGRLSQGPITAELEQRIGQWLGVPYVVMTPSGSSALVLALLACGIGPGDEIIVPNRTFMATANAVLLLGAKVKLVDVEPGRPLIDVSGIERAITPRTRAILAVHLNGRAADMQGIKVLARKYRLKVVEDAAQALGSRRAGTMLGTEGDIGAFSLGVTKLITTGQGGFAVTRDAELCERMRKLRNHGSIEPLPERYDEFGFNFKFSDLLAGMGLAQLERVADKIERHRALYRFYESALERLEFVRLLEVDLVAGELPLWIEVLCDERDQVTEHMRVRGIDVRPFLPGLCESAYLKHDGDFPNSEVYARQGLILPCGPDQPAEHLEKTIQVLGEFAARIKPSLRGAADA